MAARPEAAVALLTQLYHWLHGTSRSCHAKMKTLRGASSSRASVFSMATGSHRLGSPDVGPVLAAHTDDPVDDGNCPHRKLLSSALQRKSLARTTSSTSRSLKETLQPGSAAPGLMEIGHRKQSGMASMFDQKRSGGIDWNVVLEKPDRLYFVEEHPEPDDIFTSHAAGGPSSDRSLHEQTLVEPPFHQQYSERNSSKSLPSIRRSDSGGDRGRSKEYWVLGKLGPDMQDPKRLEKKRAYARVKAFSQKVNQINQSMKLRPMEASIMDEKKEMPRRLRALEYSKSIPKPPRRDAHYEQRQKERAENRVLSELQRLEREHEAHKERMQAIAAELHRRDASS